MTSSRFSILGMVLAGTYGVAALGAFAVALSASSSPLNAVFLIWAALPWSFLALPLLDRVWPNSPVPAFFTLMLLCTAVNGLILYLAGSAVGRLFRTRGASR
jgi:hypothetical protein